MNLERFLGYSKEALIGQNGICRKYQLCQFFLTSRHQPREPFGENQLGRLRVDDFTKILQNSKNRRIPRQYRSRDVFPELAPGTVVQKLKTIRPFAATRVSERIFHLKCPPKIQPVVVQGLIQLALIDRFVYTNINRCLIVPLRFQARD